MQLGLTFSGRPKATSNGPDLGPLIEAVERAEEYGYARISVNDLQAKDQALECFSALTLIATLTNRTVIGPCATNPVTRDVGVMANTLASIDAISGGRALLLMGRGNTAVKDVSLPAATMDELKDYVVAVQEVLASGHAVYRGRNIHGPWPTFWTDRRPRKIPIHLVAEGPKMLRLAGAIADGALIATGLTPETVRWSLEHLAAGAKQAGRDLAELDLWWNCRLSVADTEEEAWARASASIAASARRHLSSAASQETAPEGHLAAIRAYQQAYDPAEKQESDYGDRTGAIMEKNRRLLEEVGLREYALERFGVVGRPETVIQRLAYLEGLGVHKLLAMHDDEHPESLDLMGRRVLPNISAKHPALKKVG